MTTQTRETSGRSAEADRPMLTNIAYRLLGSVSDAEDAVQETYARWFAQAPEARRAVRSARGWRVRTLSRICFDVLGSARKRRETYAGPWLPEPLPDDRYWTSQTSVDGTDPSDRVALDESVSMAMLVVLERMTPAERVAFVLHDVFGVAYTPIGEALDRTPSACRQLASSARRRVRAAEPPLAAAKDHREVLLAFKRAWEGGDLEGLVAILDPDAVAVADGGGLVRAGLEPVHGAAAVARMLIAVRPQAPAMQLHEATVNGQAGLLIAGDGVVHTVIALAAAGSRVARIWAIRNPEKLGLWSAPR